MSDLKVVLVNTPLKEASLLRALKKHEGRVGFDTEVVGPQLRGRDFVNITYSSLLGFSVALEDGKTYYVPVRHKGNNVSYLGMHNILTELQRHAAGWKVWAHNAKFDHQVLLREGYPMRLADSMVAAWLTTGRNRGIGLKELAAYILDRKCPEFDPSIAYKTGDQVKLYAGHDALNTLELGKHFAGESIQGWLWQECEFAAALAEMKLRGMRLDKGMLRGVRGQAQKNLDRIHKEWDKYAPELSITSSKQLQELFIDGTWVEHGKTATGAFSTAGSAMQHNVIHANSGTGKKLAALRLEYQEVNKIVTTYTDGLLEEALQWADKKLHPDLFHFGTVTGRLSSANPNIQNQPSHGEWAHKIKACFIPDEGLEFTSADYSQIELRYFADYCGGTLARAYREGKDVHQITADAMGIDRQRGKMVNFGFLLYGGGPDKLAGELGCSPKEAVEKIAALHKQYPEVEEWRQKVITTVGGEVESGWGQPFEVVGGREPVPWCKTRAGRIRYIPELNPPMMRERYPEEFQLLVNKYRAKCKMRGKKFSEFGSLMSIRSRGERLVVNYLIQGGARDLLVVGMNNYRRNAPEGFSLVTTVHDEVLTQHPAGRGEQARKLLKESLEAAGPYFKLRVPILAEPKTGSNWAEVK